MDKTHTIEDFYRHKLEWMPESIQKEMGHFNIFRLGDFTGPCAKPMPYSRKDFYKISLIVGRNNVHYADKTVQIEKNAILFANPHIPYNWEPIDEEQSGFFCIFTEAFFSQFPAFRDYPVFKPGGRPILLLTDEQVRELSSVYLKMFDEIESDYLYKYDLLRNYVLELVHFALKLQPARTIYSSSNAAARISSLFMELMERQFPIESPFQQIKFRSAIEFARQLAVHVNHLNRALRETTGKTTSELIAERLTQEAVALLKHTTWNVSEIAYTLGFEEPTHFNNFFKKRTQQTPTKFRIV
jgi:AraC family transcriptional regulator, transcriptional activator of pobA